MEIIMIVLPAFIIFAAGFVGQKLLSFHIKSISSMALYLMLPFLAFDTFYSNPLNEDYFYMFLYTTLLIIVLVIITIIIGKGMKASRSQLSVMILGTGFPNSGNYGAPIALFAFGQQAFQYAIIIMVIHAFIINSIGIFIASYGSDESASVKDSIMSVVKMPVMYGAIAGIFFQLLHIELSSTMVDAIHLIGTASIPTIMLVLGMQLAEIKRQTFSLKYIHVITWIRMVVSPLLAVVCVYFMPVSDLIKDVFILLAAMPVAANTILLAVQFDVEAELLSFSTLVTTVISLVTIPLVLFLLGV